MTALRFCLLFGLAVSGSVLNPPIAFGIVNSDPNGDFVVPIGTALGDAVGTLTSAFGTEQEAKCSCALLPTRSHVLTAAHCVRVYGKATEAFATWQTATGPVQLQASAIEVHPAFESFYDHDPASYTAGFYAALWQGVDLAVLTLESAAPTGVTSVDILRDNSGLEFSDSFLRIGYGAYGVGDEGWTNPPDGQKRFGWNEWDTYEEDVIPHFDAYGLYPENFLFSDFDSGLEADSALGGLGLGLIEAASAPGDSGSPSFIGTAAGTRIAGVTSGGYGINSSWGSIGFDIRVSSLLNQRFIDLVSLEEKWLGDVDLTGDIDVNDINTLFATMWFGGAPLSHRDLNGDGSVTFADVDTLVRDLLQTEYGV
ncbi:MAG: hypothetical protein WD851_23715 [Pirellulales bacterium]